MRRLNGNFTDFLTKLLDHLFHQCSHFSVLSAHWFLAGIHSANWDPEISKCAWPTSKFLVFPHITSKPLLTGGLGTPHQDVSAAGSLFLNLHPAETLLVLIWSAPQVAALPLWLWQCCSQQAKEFLAILLSGEGFITLQWWCETHPRVWEGDSTLEPHSITRVPVTATGASPREALQEGDEKLPPTTWTGVGCCLDTGWGNHWSHGSLWAAKFLTWCFMGPCLSKYLGSAYLWLLCLFQKSVLAAQKPQSGTILLKCWLDYLLFEPGCHGKAIHVQQAVENSF